MAFKRILAGCKGGLDLVCKYRASRYYVIATTAYHGWSVESKSEVFPGPVKKVM